jgi:heptosyltransferase I
MLPLAAPPRSVCLLRLSAIGDTCHTVPILRTLQLAWPETQFTWIVGKTEARLMSLIEDVELIIVDKRAGLGARREIRRQLGDRHFDVLLHMQLAFRASLISREIRATVKLGFDRARARELQWLFTNARIAPRRRQHVVDSFFGFTEALGVQNRVVSWDLPLPADAQAYAQALIPDARPTLVISPCSSHALRNWLPDRYAAIADYAARHHGMRVILCGGPTAIERDMGAAIEAAAETPLINQIGKDTLPQLLALLDRASVVVAPDSGPVHMATMVRTPVVGLYAATNPARSGPYLSRPWCVNAYPEAARRFRGRAPERLPWTEKIEERGVMALITVEQVKAKLDQAVQYSVRESL